MTNKLYVINYEDIHLAKDLDIDFKYALILHKGVELEDKESKIDSFLVDHVHEDKELVFVGLAEDKEIEYLVDLYGAKKQILNASP